MLSFIGAFVAACVVASKDTAGGAGSIDADADGFTADVDCDDRGAGVNPGAIEACNGVDDDCDGETDEAGATGTTTWYADADGDGHGDLGLPTQACTRPDGAVADADDCDDTRPDVHPGAQERCDDADNDCDASVDEDAADATGWYADLDEDGFGAGDAVFACTAPAGLVATDDDCDDTTAEVFPGAPEQCDAVDQDCDAETRDDDAVDAPVRFADGDGDGFGDAAVAITSCDPVDGFVDDATDCDDGARAVNPSAVELCNGEDDDCDAETDEDDAADALTWYADSDADTFGDPTAPYDACAAPVGFVADATDCDDARSDVSPLGTERCNTLDDDCDGETDESSATDAATWYADADGDGFGDAATFEAACSAPTGAVADASDCDDAAVDTYPGADERCDGEDDDCDGATDEDDAVDAPEWYYDDDGDGFGASGYGTACTDPGGVVADGGDCDDANAAINPGETETCDGVDTDCSGDETNAINATRWFTDGDGDGYGEAGSEVRDCTQPAGTARNDTDCDDAIAAVNPGASEVCGNLTDDNCSGDGDACGLAGAMTAWDAWVTANTGNGTTTAPQVLDVDGDGFDDLVTGNIYDGSGGTSAGGGAVYLGPITSAGRGADVTLVGENAGDWAGYRVVGVGDLGGTARPYLALAAPYTTVSGRAYAGTVYLFGDVPTSGASVDLSLCDARVDGDASSLLGISGAIAGIGDTDGDGLDELVVGRTSGGSVSGRVAAFDVASGGTLREADAVWTIDGTEVSDSFGAEAVPLGDDDGDGLADFAVSAPLADAGGTNAGAVYVFHASVLTSTSLTAADATVVLLSTAATPGFGTDLSAGDIDGDGAQDIVGGSHGDYFAFVELGPFYGKGTADLSSLDTRRSKWFNTVAGDVDADGADDLLDGYYLGMSGRSGRGEVSLTYGPSALGTASLGGWSASTRSETSNATSVRSRPGGGDVDGDGYADVLVPMYAACASSSLCGGLTSGGYIAIQYGSGG